MPVQVRRNWTAREVRQLIAEAPLASPRYELVDGELLVTPSPGIPHQLVVGELFVALRQYVNENGVGVAMISPSDVELEDESIAQPDIYVAKTAQWTRVLAEGFPLHELVLAVEILSPSSKRYDRVTKRPLYLRHVPEYWTVDPVARVVERWRAGEELPEVLTHELIWQPPHSTPPLTIDLPRLFATALRDPIK